MPTTLPTRRLGTTDLHVTRIGFGAASIGGLYTAIDDAQAIATVERAWDLGIRLFDTAPLYGYGTAERRLGAVLANRPRDAFVLSTKVGRLVRREDEIGPRDDVDPQGPAVRRAREHSSHSTRTDACPRHTARSCVESPSP